MRRHRHHAPHRVRAGVDQGDGGAVGVPDQHGVLYFQLQKNFRQKTQGFTITKDWRGHNTHFLWYAALMQGRGDAALAAARTLAERAKGRDHTFAEYTRSLPLLTLLRLERWDAVLAEPLPVGERGMAQVLSAQAQGSAQARLRRSADAKASLLVAEAIYREDLKARPDNGWALNGLARALAAQGKSAEAAAMRERVGRAWVQADAGLKTPS